MKLKTLIEAFLQGAEQNIKSDGKILPIFVFIHKDQVCMQPLIFENNQDKEDFSAYVKKLIEQDKISEYIMLTEAWTVHEKNLIETQEWMRKNGSLQNHPNRKEMVILQYSSVQEEISYTAEIIRGTIVSLDKWNATQNTLGFKPEHLSTRFQGLFIKGKAGLN